MSMPKDILFTKMINNEFADAHQHIKKFNGVCLLEAGLTAGDAVTELGSFTGMEMTGS